jgi:hypothetical protein
MAGYDINNRNFIVGNGLMPNGRWEAFVWSKAGFSQVGDTVGIGFFPGAASTVAHAINDNNEVAGLAYLDVVVGAPTSAFYWKKGTGIVPMQTLGGIIGAGLDINLAGSDRWLEQQCLRTNSRPPSGATTRACHRISGSSPAAPLVTPTPLTARDKSSASRMCPKRKKLCSANAIR